MHQSSGMWVRRSLNTFSASASIMVGHLALTPTRWGTGLLSGALARLSQVQIYEQNNILWRQAGPIFHATLRRMVGNARPAVGGWPDWVRAAQIYSPTKMEISAFNLPVRICLWGRTQACKSHVETRQWLFVSRGWAVGVWNVRRTGEMKPSEGGRNER